MRSGRRRPSGRDRHREDRHGDQRRPEAEARRTKYPWRIAHEGGMLERSGPLWRGPMLRTKLMRLPRLTTRRLMVLVAVTAVGLAVSFEVSRLRELRRRHLRSAQFHAREQVRALQFKKNRLGPLFKMRGGRIPYLAESDEEFARWLEGRARYYDDSARRHDMLRKRYERAARYPWLPHPLVPPPW
jgi:hypothetical protein